MHEIHKLKIQNTAKNYTILYVQVHNHVVGASLNILAHAHNNPTPITIIVRNPKKHVPLTYS